MEPIREESGSVGRKGWIGGSAGAGGSRQGKSGREVEENWGR